MKRRTRPSRKSRRDSQALEAQVLIEQPANSSGPSNDGGPINDGNPANHVVPSCSGRPSNDAEPTNDGGPTNTAEPPTDSNHALDAQPTPPSKAGSRGSSRGNSRSKSQSRPALAVPRVSLSRSLEENLESLARELRGIAEFTVRHLGTARVHCALAYMSGLVDVQEIEMHIIKPIESLAPETRDLPKVSISGISSARDVRSLVRAIVDGKAVLLVDGHDEAMVYSVEQRPARSVERPETERSIIGPKESFTESLETNIALVRSRLRIPAIKSERYRVGSSSQTAVALMYDEQTADESMLDAVRKALKDYPGDTMSHVSDLTEVLEGSVWSPFPQVHETERPDSAAANMIEGRVVLLAEGSPSAIIAPIAFFELFKATEDYYIRPLLSSANRMLRFLAFVVTLTAVPVYVALTAYHYDMIPLRLLIPIAQNRANVPFSPITEALILDVSVELLREAGVRLPKPLGQTLGVAAALVIGQSVLAANLVSPALVIAVGFTSLASFVIPSFGNFLGLRLLRFPITLLAGFA